MTTTGDNLDRAALRAKYPSVSAMRRLAHVEPFEMAEDMRALLDALDACEERRDAAEREAEELGLIILKVTTERDTLRKERDEARVEVTRLRAAALEVIAASAEVTLSDTIALEYDRRWSMATEALRILL